MPTSADDLYKLFTKISSQLDELIETTRLGQFALPLSEKWDYQVFAGTSPLSIAAGGKFVLVDNEKIAGRPLHGNLMSVAAGLSSSSAEININYFLKNRAIKVTNSLANFLLGGFNQAVPSALVVENNPSSAIPWTARLLNGTLVPFSRPFNISISNPTSSAITLFAYEVELILLKP